jgi:hypothetical protein
VSTIPVIKKSLVLLTPVSGIFDIDDDSFTGDESKSIKYLEDPA